jgi:hypothetical protein
MKNFVLDGALLVSALSPSIALADTVTPGMTQPEPVHGRSRRWGLVTAMSM